MGSKQWTEALTRRTVDAEGAAENAARGIGLNILLMQNIQTAASVLTHSAKPHSRILPQRGIRMEQNCTIPDDNEIETLAELFKKKKG